jgi:hypothetical protein
VAASGGNGRSGIRDYLIPHAADRSPGIPVEVRPDVGASLSAGFANELWFEIGRPDMIGPWICADRDRVATLIVCAVNQDARHGGGAHLSNGAKVIFCGRVRAGGPSGIT